MITYDLWSARMNSRKCLMTLSDVSEFINRGPKEKISKGIVSRVGFMVCQVSRDD